MAVKTTLTAKMIKSSLESLKKANAEFAGDYPGDSAERQPVHTVYGGAHLFKAETAAKLGAVALNSLDEHASDYASFGRAIGLLPEGVPDDASDRLARLVYEKVRGKLQTEPVEDFRIDFEDGYGNRSDAEEDGHALAAALELARGMAEKSLPPFIGIRVKPFSAELHARSLRTLDILVTALMEEAGKLPSPFIVTIPKITVPEQVETLAEALDLLESNNGIKKGAIKIELMIETPQSVLAPGGRAALRRLVKSAHGRCSGAHFGTYDYTASLNISAFEQRMDHRGCDFAKHIMQVSLAGSGVMLSDGATNVMPVGDRNSVARAWRLHYNHVRHSLVHAFYQGWDLHPAQLPTRYAAVYAFFLEGLAPASLRLKNFIEKAAQATLVGDVFDDAATGQGLLNYFLRGMSCGAFGEAEAAAAGLTHQELKTRSFLKILHGRKAKIK